MKFDTQREKFRWTFIYKIFFFYCEYADIELKGRKVYITDKVYQKFQFELPFATYINSSKYSVNCGTTKMLLYLIESGAAHHFVNGKVIQRNFVKSYTPFREFPSKYI